VESTETFTEAFGAARAAGSPAIIHVKYATDAISPGQSLDAVRAEALRGTSESGP
jgi:acetolactate synthase-1/2/3 large subunit